MYISHSFFSIFCWSTLYSVYSLHSSWVWCYKLDTPGFLEVSQILICTSFRAPWGWMGSICAIFSTFDRCSCLGSGLATQGHPETLSKDTSLSSWLCAQSRCPVWRWTFAPVWDPKFFQADLPGLGYHNAEATIHSHVIHAEEFSLSFLTPEHFFHNIWESLLVSVGKPQVGFSEWWPPSSIWSPYHKG